MERSGIPAFPRILIRYLGTELPLDSVAGKKRRGLGTRVPSLLQAAILALAAVASAQAQQDNFRTFTESDGLTDLSVSSFLQDRTGFLWIGTNNGLFRYDGHRFRRFGVESGLWSASISSLAEANDGTLWIGSLNGVSHKAGDHFLREKSLDSFPTQGEQTLARDPFGDGMYIASTKGLVLLSAGGKRTIITNTAGRAVWSVFSEAGKGVWYALTDEVCLWNGISSQCYGAQAGFFGQQWGGLVKDGDGTLWTRSVTSLLALPAGAARFESRNQGLPSTSINGIACLDSHERLMIPTDGGLARWAGAGWSLITAKDGLIVAATTWAMEDREGSLWVGMLGGGLARRLGGQEWENWTTAQGLADDQIWGIARDRTGAILIGTGFGLDRLRDGHIEHVPGTNLGLVSNRVRAISVDSDNTVWLGTSPGGLARLDSRTGGIVRIDGLPASRIFSLVVDRNHTVWIGAGNGLFRGSVTAGRWVWQKQSPPDAGEAEIFYNLLEDRGGRLWAAGSEGLAEWDGQMWQRLVTWDGQRNRLASFLAEGPDGSIWVAYRDTGDIDRVSEGRNGRLVLSRVLSDHKRELPDVSRFLGFDRAGNLWRGTGAGVLVLDRHNHWIRYTRGDGLAWDATTQNTFLSDPDGSVWLGTSHGLSHHGKFTEPSSTPQAMPVIDGVQAGGSVLSLDKPLRIGNREGAVVFSYASLTFRREGELFRYRLRGLDKAWTDTNEWQARYTGLKPGSYVFEVGAVTSNGQLSSKIVGIPVTITGPWWSSTEFFAGIAILFMGALLAWVRNRQMTDRELRDAKEEADSARGIAESAKEAAESAREAAQSANRSKSVFLANMSHEIRTPLNAVLGYSQLMLRDPSLSGGSKDNLSIINRSGEHLLTLINDILDMSKIEAGKVTLTPVVFDLFDVLTDLELMFRLRAEAKGLRFEVLEESASNACESACPDCIEADKGKIRQVLVNLLGNAIKFTDAGSVTLRVSMNRRENESLRLFFAVEDTGPGIAAEEQSKLFQPFAQSANGRQNKGGTGLGLAISRELVRLMGGEIMLSSEMGTGSTFYFEVPVRPGEMTTRKLRKERGRVIGLQAGAEATRVLVVDDEPNNRGWLTSLLKAVGFAVREAENGQTGIRLWQEWNPQLILMDMRMPVMDGMETTRRIRALPGGRETVILALTASAMEENRRSAMNSGVDDFLSKPCMEDELFEKIQKYLGLDYVIEEEKTSAGDEAGVAGQTLEADVCRKLPPELIFALQQAVDNGEKDYLDQLIANVAEFDKPAARALGQLANNYDYDALTHLLEEVRS